MNQSVEPTRLPTPGYVGGSLRPSPYGEAGTMDLLHREAFKDGLTFKPGKLTYSVVRDYAPYGSGDTADDPQLLVRVGYRTSPRLMLDAAWFLITTALKRMVSR